MSRVYMRKIIVEPHRGRDQERCGDSGRRRCRAMGRVNSPFEKWRWKKFWDWGMPPTFGAVGSGKEVCIFLCQGAQGGRGRGANTTTFQQHGDEEGDKGVWMSVWVDDVDEMHKHCVAARLEVTFPPTDMPWNVREMHLRHPDGHVLRVGRGFEVKK